MLKRNNYQKYFSQHTYKIGWIYKPKLHSRCNKNASTAFLNLKFSLARSPELPLRDGQTHRSCSPRLVPSERHSVNAFGVQWPDHFSKAGDGPELGLTVKSTQNGNDQEPIQSSSTSRSKHQTGQAQPRLHLKLEQRITDGTIFPNRWPHDYPEQY